jgi:broad specificity phosphatase PhoE
LREIVFVRHAESQANRDGVWNGRTDGPLSDEGRRTLGPLADRLADRQFDRVISSPLGRARATAEVFADEIEINDQFIEIDLGIWEGRRLEEIRAEHPEELEKAIRDRDVPMGRTGETLNQAGHRAIDAVDSLAESLEDGQTAAVVTHGGFLQAVLHRHLTGDGRRVHAFTSNTGITRIVYQFGRPRLSVFNDVGHLGPHSELVASHLRQGNPVMALIRHGRTKANVDRIWQGHGDWDLDEIGRIQAEALGEWYGPRKTVYASPLKRAMTTAEHVARNGVIPVEELKEIRMGRWEGLRFEEITERWPGAMETIYRDGVDLKRGETGESWGELTARFSSAIAGLELDESEQTAVVAHGGAIRSYISSLTRTKDTYSESLATPDNTSVTHVAVTQRGPEILDYSVAAHLEDLDLGES